LWLAAGKLAVVAASAASRGGVGEREETLGIGYGAPEAIAAHVDATALGTFVGVAGSDEASPSSGSTGSTVAARAA
jgi:hypothetical protein